MSKGSLSKAIQVPKRITESSSKATKSTLEGDNFNPNTSNDQVYDLLGFNPRLTSPTQVMPFSRIIVDITEGKQDPKLILDIMNACTDKAVYHEVLQNPIAVTSLYNLRTIIGHTGKYVRDYLNILLKLPFDMKVFGECNFVTYAKTVKKKNLEDHDLIKLADYVRRNWQTAAEAAAFKVKNDTTKVTGNVTEKVEPTTSIENKNTGSKKPTVVVAPKRPFQNTDGKNIDGKRLKTDDKKSPSASSFFKRLNEPATLPKIKVSESKQTSGPESAESVDGVKLAFDDVQIPSYRKTSNDEAPMEVDASIDSSGKKSVRFKGAAELQSIKIFEMEDPPMKIVNLN